MRRTQPRGARPSGGRVLVVGSLNVDLVARVARLPLAGETVSGADLVRTPGGKGLNQAVAAARAGAAVTLAGQVGDDEPGRWLLEVATGEGVDTAAVRTVDAPTGTALITVASDGANTIVVSPGANRWVAPTSPAGVVAAASGSWSVSPRAGDVVLCQAEVPQGAVTAACAAARSADATSVVNLAPFRDPEPGQWELVDVAVVNETELVGLLAASGVAGVAGVAGDGGGEPGRVDPAGSAATARAWAEEAGRALLAARPGPGTLVVSVGASGAVAVPADGPAHLVGAPRVAAVDTVGAGDCLTGWLAAGLAGGWGVGPALERAVVAASIAVQRHGAAASMPTATEVAAVLDRSGAAGHDR